jgi:hypothetical protein
MTKGGSYEIAGQARNDEGGLRMGLRIKSAMTHGNDYGNGKTPSEPIRVPLLERGNCFA